MARKPEKNFLRAWRELRGMTQAELAEQVQTTGPVISLLESGARGLSDKWLRRLAPVLKTTPGHLLDSDPNALDESIMDIWDAIPEESQALARDVLKTFMRKADAGATSALAQTADLHSLDTARTDRRRMTSKKPRKSKASGGGETPEGV